MNGKAGIALLIAAVGSAAVMLCTLGGPENDAGPLCSDHGYVWRYW